MDANTDDAHDARDARDGRRARAPAQEGLMLAVILAVMVMSATLASGECVEPIGCDSSFENAPGLLCNETEKTCVVYPNHCNGLARLLSSGLITSGYTILIRTDTQPPASSAAACTYANPKNCANIAAIKAIPATTSVVPRLCLPLGSAISAKNVTLYAPTRATLYVPERKLVTTACSGLSLYGSDITIRGVEIDMTNCQEKSVAVYIDGMSAKLDSVWFRGTYQCIVINAAQCGDGMSITDSRIFGPGTSAGCDIHTEHLFLVSTCYGDITVTDVYHNMSTVPSKFPGVVYGTTVNGVDADGIWLDIGKRISSSVLRCPSCNCDSTSATCAASAANDSCDCGLNIIIAWVFTGLFAVLLIWTYYIQGCFFPSKTHAT